MPPGKPKGRTYISLLQRNFPSVNVSPLQPLSTMLSSHFLVIFPQFTFLEAPVPFSCLVTISCAVGVHAQLLSRVQLSVITWTVAYQAPLLTNYPGKNTGVGCHFLLQGSSQVRDRTHISCVCCILKRILYHCAMGSQVVPRSKCFFGFSLLFCEVSNHVKILTSMKKYMTFVSLIHSSQETKPERVEERFFSPPSFPTNNLLIYLSSKW